VHVSTPLVSRGEQAARQTPSTVRPTPNSLEPLLIPPKTCLHDRRRSYVSEHMKPSSGNEHTWRFVTNHAHVLECIFAHPDARLRDIAAGVGITERTAAQIVNDLVAAGYLSKTRNGRRNTYQVHGELPLRHPRHRHRTVGDLIRFLETRAD
jgi:Winged helix-turn-helix DNA-binding